MPGCLQLLSSSRPKIHSHVTGVEVLTAFFLFHGFFDCANLLSTCEFHGVRWCGGGFGSCGGCFGGISYFVDVRVGILVFGAVACHVALEVTHETSALLSQLGAFFWGEFLEVACSCGGVYVHWDNVWIHLVQCSLLVLVLLGHIIVVCLLIATLRTYEPCIVFFLGSRDLGAYCSFPFVHGAGNFVSVQSFAVDAFA